MELAGVIHLQDISQPHVKPAVKELNLKLDFRQLYPPSAINNVILATTKWSEVDLEQARVRERELFRAYQIGPNMVRFDGTRESAQAIIDLILE